jgi:uncharacterized SAM-binding protein YcdF (DUF218 family)
MAVCVLGCRVSGKAFARRVAAAAEAFKVEMSVGDALLLACGGTRWDGLVEADEIARLAAQHGIPAEKIVKERRSRDTFENAVEAAKILADKPTVLVTCSWHLPRARFLFERARVNVIRTVGARPPSPTLLDRVWWYGREQVSLWRDLVR